MNDLERSKGQLWCSAGQILPKLLTNLAGRAIVWILLLTQSSKEFGLKLYHKLGTQHTFGRRRPVQARPKLNCLVYTRSAMSAGMLLHTTLNVYIASTFHKIPIKIPSNLWDPARHCLCSIASILLSHPLLIVCVSVHTLWLIPITCFFFSPLWQMPCCWWRKG